MSDALKALTKETKALILVSEYEARRMPVFQMRAVLNAIVTDDEEKRVIIDLIDRDLRATGYPADQIATFLTDLLAATPARPVEMMNQGVQSTRRLRSPFALGFEGSAPPPAPPTTPLAAEAASPSVQQPASATRVSFMKPAAYAPLPPPDAPAGMTPPSNPPTARRNTFVFGAPTPSDKPTAAQAQAAAARPPSSATEPAVGTAAWRAQQAFGKPGAPAGPGGKKPLVVIADDDKRIRMVFRLRMEEAGMSVVEFDNGADAWTRIQQNDASAAVLDMKMPGLHGLEVLSQMAAKQMTMPVVVCSAYDQLQDEFVVRTYPCIRYLVKPVAPDTLVATLKELMSQKTKE